MQPEEYIESFFREVKSQLHDAQIARDERSARYKRSEVAAKWSDDLWHIRLVEGDHDPVLRQYNPANARSTQSAANYFVDALRRANGEEVPPREPTNVRGFRKRSSPA